ncbi:MAG: RNA methyltransferase [Bacteroidota bacterium]
MESLSKAKLKLFASLHQKKYRYEHALFLVEGKKLLVEAARSAWPLECVIINDARGEAFLSVLGELSSVPAFSLGERDFKKLSTQVSSEGILGVAKMPKPRDWPIYEHTSALLLEKVNDPGNLGTLLRTADWFGVHRIYCSPDTVDVYNPKVLRSSMGAFFRAEFSYVDDWDSFIQSYKSRIWLADMEGLYVKNHTFKKGEWILLGNEANGVSPKTRNSLPDRKLTIDGSGKGESLNVGVAGGIFLYHLFMGNS